MSNIENFKNKIIIITIVIKNIENYEKFTLIIDFKGFFSSHCGGMYVIIK